jgi:PAS domain S-box-containing protein
MNDSTASTVFDAMPDGVVVHDPETGEIVDVNQTYLDMHGYASDEIVGETVAAISADDPAYSLEEALDRIRQAREEGPVQFEWRNRRADGTEFPVEVSLNPVELDGQQRVVANVRDISDRKVYQQQYREASRHLEAILEATKFGLFIKNTDHEYIVMNERVKEIFGLDEFDPGITDEDVVSEDVAQRFQADDRYVMETEEPLRTEEEVPVADVGTRIYLTIKVPVYDATGDLYGIAGFTQDITEKKTYERRLEALNTRLELALDETDTGVWELDLDTDELIWDEASERLFGYDSGEFPGTFEAFADRIDETDVAHVSEQIEHSIETGEEYRAEFRVGPREEDQRWLQARGVVEYDEEEPTRIIGIQTDITEQKQREQALRAAKQEVERHNEQLEEFASFVSHDLRNPLGVAHTYAEMVREGDQQAIEEVSRSLDRMEAIIQDALSYARQGQTIDETEQLNLSTVARLSWQNIDTAGAELVVDTEEAIVANRDRVMRLFENCFRNSVEHSSTGNRTGSDDSVDHGGEPVVVRIDTLEGSHRDGEHSGGFCIADDGPGIPAEDRDSVFEIGYSTADTGTGFGLGIVKQVAKAHGWRVEITDSQSGGARFEFHGVDIGDTQHLQPDWTL